MSAILIVEDESELRDILARSAEVHNWPWFMAADGADALQKYFDAKAADKPFDLLVLDIAMAPQCGLEVARQIRKSGDDQTRIAFYTGYDGVLNRQASQDLGAVAFWVKPLDPYQLHAKILSVLPPTAP